MLLGFAVLPPLPAFLVYVAFELLWQFFGHASFRPVSAEQAARAMALVTGLFGVGVTICGAIPVVFWLIREERASFRALVIAGAVLGNAPLAFYALAFVLPATINHLWLGTMSEHMVPMTELIVRSLRVVALGSVLGVSSAVTFWLVGFSDWRR